MASEDSVGEAPARSDFTLGVKTLIVMGGPAVGLAIGGMAVVMPKIEAALAHDDWDKFLVKMMGVGAVGAAMVIGAPLTGFLADRLGLRRVLFLNYLLFTLAGSAGLYLTNLEVLVAARFLLGIAGSGAVTASIIVINKVLPPGQRAQWMGAYIAMNYVAGLALTPAAGYLAEINWHLPFGLYLFGAPLAWLALRSFPAEARAVKSEAEVKADAEPLWSWFPFRFALLGLVMGAIVYLPIIYMPFLLRDMGFGPKMASLVILGDTITGMVTAILFGRARRRISAHTAFIFAFATTAIGGIVTGTAHGYAQVFIGMAIMGFGIGWFMPNLMLLLSERVLDYRQGRAAGLVKSANYLSTPICIFATERLAQLYGPRIPILIGGVLAFGLLLLVIGQMLARRNRGGPPLGEAVPAS